MTKDPVCEMPIEEDDANVLSKYKGRTYYFCSEICKEEFNGNEDKYLKNIDLGEDYEIDHSA